MKTILILAISILSCAGINAQTLQNNHSVTYFYIVNFDQILLDIFDSTDPNNIINKSYKSPTNKGFVADIMDTFYCIASKKFQTELNLELLPLNTLQGKVNYSNSFPECPYKSNIKKVMKTASGYQYYIDYYINITADYSDQYKKLPLTRIRPVYELCFAIYDNNGKQIKEISLSYKSKRMLLNEREKVDNTSQEMKSRLCSVYNEALNELTTVYKKDEVALL